MADVDIDGGVIEQFLGAILSAGKEVEVRCRPRSLSLKCGDTGLEPRAPAMTRTSWRAI